MSFVYVKLPKSASGLGNKFLTWSKGVVFGHINQLPIYTINWYHIHKGAILRNEKTKRWYKGNFVDLPFLKTIEIFVKHFFYQRTIEPNFLRIFEHKRNTIFEFNSVPAHTDYFFGLREHRGIIIDSLRREISSSVWNELSKKRTPIIGVHIRRGDLPKKELTSSQDFINIILTIRRIVGRDLLVTVFSDARRSELSDILSLPNVTLSEEGSDILEMLLLSRSKVIVTSFASTFSYWAGFISDSPMIRQKMDDRGLIRSPEYGKGVFEGRLDGNNDVAPSLLVENLQELLQ